MRAIEQFPLAVGALLADPIGRFALIRLPLLTSFRGHG
jgi:hypothetical protein